MQTLGSRLCGNHAHRVLGVAILSIAALILGALLGAAAARLKERPETIEQKIYDLLPHTQCAQCGYPGCRPYAQAVARGAAAITLCPPGGAPLVAKLAELVGTAPSAMTAANLAGAAPVRVARVDEAHCIGCALCLPACPVDAIIGAPRQMHTVVAALCTGCELCLAPCPVDCISMVAASAPQPDWLRTAQTSDATRTAAQTIVQRAA